MDEFAPLNEGDPSTGSELAVPAGGQPAVRHRRSARRWLALGVALILVVAGVSLALSSSPSPASAEVLVAQAASGSLSTGTFAFTLNGKMEVAGETITMHGTGHVDSAAKAMSASLNLSGLGHSGQINEVLADGTMYLGSSLFASQLPAGISWISVPIPTSASLGTTSPSGSVGDPSQILKTLSTTTPGVSVDDLGASTVEGSPVHRYRVNISAEALRSKIDGLPLSQAQRDQAAQLVGSGGETLVVAIDDQHRVRQLEVQVSTSSSGLTMTEDITMTLSDFGVPVTISAPASSSVLSEAGALNQLGVAGA